MGNGNESKVGVAIDRIQVPLVIVASSLLTALGVGWIASGKHNEALTEMVVFRSEISGELKSLNTNLERLNRKVEAIDGSNLKRNEFNAWVREAIAANRGKDVVFPDAPK